MLVIAVEGTMEVLGISEIGFRGLSDPLDRRVPLVSNCVVGGWAVILLGSIDIVLRSEMSFLQARSAG